MKLYLCGNGFDLHHALLTGYKNYREYLKIHDRQVYDDYEHFPEIQYDYDRWEDLEVALTINYEKYLSDFLELYILDRTEDKNTIWSELEVEIDESTRFFYLFTGELFMKWISSIDITEGKVDYSLDLSENDFYVNFNYTNTIQELYNIPENHVLHIHGSIKQIDTTSLTSHDILPSFSTIEEAEVLEPIAKRHLHNSDMIRSVIQFGATGFTPDEIKSKLDRICINSNCDDESELAINLLISIVEATTKNIYKNFKKLENFISGKEINEVVIMGHSLAPADLPYYHKILIPLLAHCKWSAMCYGDEKSIDAIRIAELEKKANIKIEIINW